MANIPMPEGLSNKDLECVMLDLPTIDITGALGDDFNPDDLYYSSSPDLRYVQGAVAEGTPHVTLLFGIHPSDTYKEDVYSALDGWEPDPILIRSVSFFPSRKEGEDYNCIVGKVISTANLLNGHRRLEALPYTNAFPEYVPHVSLAYIKWSADLSMWMDKLDKAVAQNVYEVMGLNLGEDL